MIESEVQVFFQVAEEELNAIGAENISCSHWRMKQSERNLYNTIASGSDDLLRLEWPAADESEGQFYETYS